MGGAEALPKKTPPELNFDEERNRVVRQKAFKKWMKICKTNYS
jgi:hypothetical protein